MGDKRKLVGFATLGWMLVTAIAVVLFFSGIARLTLLIAGWTDSEVLYALSLPVTAVVGLLLWPQVLGLLWRARLASMRRTGDKTAGTVVETGYKRVQRTNGLDQHRVRIETEFRHPGTGAEHRIRKEYVFNQFRLRRARSLQERFPEGSSVPMRVRGNYAVFDIGERPTWGDMW
ncbi:hypothetical protein ACWIGI_26995 [Nocardia sp. NPDC055321]